MTDEMPRLGLPPETSLEEVKVRIRQSYRNPNVGRIHQVVLKDGPQAFRIATLLEIIDPKTSELHHYSLKIDSIDKRKTGWFSKPDKSVRLEGYNPNEIEQLYFFLNALIEGKLSGRTGDLHIIGENEYEKLEMLIEALPNLASSDKIQLVSTILPYIEAESSHVNDFLEAFKNSNPETVRHISVASRFVEYQQSCNRLRELINDDQTSEQDLQGHLESNPWIFGSEYSELLDRRSWTRDEKLDFMLRRTVDNFLEIIEIKTPFRESLLKYDKSHDSYYPSSKLSTVLGQVIRYIEEVERNRDYILCKDHCDTLKIRAKVVIGRDGEEDHQTALRNLNSHLHRIEVITFDQLLRISTRILDLFVRKTVNEDIPSDGEISF